MQPTATNYWYRTRRTYRYSLGLYYARHAAPGHDSTRTSSHWAPCSHLVVHKYDQLSAGAAGGRESEARTVRITRVCAGNFVAASYAYIHRLRRFIRCCRGMAHGEENARKSPADALLGCLFRFPTYEVFTCSRFAARRTPYR